MAPGKGPLRIAIEDFLNTFGFGKRVSGWLQDRLETWEKEALDSYQNILVRFGIADNLPPEFQPANFKTLFTHQIELIAAIIPFIWALATQLVGVAIAPFMRPIGYLAESLAHNKHPDAITIQQMIQRRPDLEAQLRSLLPSTGYDQVSLDGFSSLIKQLLNGADYERLKLRGTLTADQAHEKMSRAGLSEEDIAGLDELINVIPSPQDLVQMAVREAWNEETVQRFKYDSDFENIGEAVEWMKKQGLSEDFAKRYWRAHWQLPGIGNVYEMLHRLRSGDTATTIDDVKLFLKTADIPEYWRDRLIAISYAPYTRIDIRRMWKLRILSEDDVYQAHLDIGYDEEHARKLTQFVVADQSSDKSDLTRAAVIQAFKRGIYSRDQAKTAMLGLGLSDSDAEFYLGLADYDIEAQMTDVQLSVIQAKYVNGTIDETGLATELGKLNLPSDRMTALQALWNIQRNNKTNIPGRADLDDLLRRSIIDAQSYHDLLKRDGYEETVIGYYTQRVQQVIAADAAAELAAQQTEQQRLAIASLASTYAKNKAEIQVEIAQFKTAIADINVALATISDPNQVTQLKQQIVQYKDAIVTDQQRLAELYQQYVQSKAPPGA